MKTRLPLILLVAVVLVSASLLAIYLGRRSAGGRGSRPPSTTPTVEPVEPPTPSPAASPREAVALYLEALERNDFRTAHRYLSADSREAHPYDEFLKLCERGEATNYDVAAARERPGADDRVVVMIPLVEDPAEASFTTSLEAEGWKVVFIGGAPWFPYP